MPRDNYYLPKRPLVEQERAAIIQTPTVPRSKFTGTWTRKTAFRSGQLVPILVDEILPGDHMTYDVTAYIRMATPLFPIFDNQTVSTFFFFVPARLVWQNWVRMMGEQDSPSDSINYSVPVVVLDNTHITANSIFDHMGLPNQIAAGESISVNVLPFRAYNLIYNEWFRDENIQTAATEHTDNGPDLAADYVLIRRGKAHDYFTSALPWPQKFTAPNIPLLGTAPITGLGQVGTTAGTGAGSFIQTGNTTSSVYTHTLRAELPWTAGVSAGDPIRMGQVETSPGSGQWVPDVYADLTQATGVAINQLRQAFMIQSLLERDARGGTRYTELIRSHFSVINPDFRLQRPEYIGGGTTPLNITPIAQTAPTTGVTVGALGAAATAAGRHHASYAATEHGYILGLINVRTELSYQQGLHKMWTRQTRYDFYFPVLAQMGEQAILRQEIYTTGVDTDDSTVFGYQARWEEYRTRYSEVTGYMRSTFTPGTLDAWHLAQNFSSPPTLSDTFIVDNPPMARVLAAGSTADNQQYLGDILYRRTAVRPIPTFGTPANLGRF